jgi:hypothetical protein
MRIASHVLLYNQDKWILQNIANAAPFVEKIYVAWSEEPWLYNKNARKDFKNKSNLDVLKQSEFFDKIVLIRGKWDTEEAQRNACVEAAKKDGMDYLLIHDADEFYTYEDFGKIIQGISNNPGFDYYKTGWISFWKDFSNIIIKGDGQYIIGYPEIALNLKKDIKFQRCRRLTGSKYFILDALCYHASYVLTDDECWEKINTWGHSHQFNTKKWFDEKWKAWNENSRNLHPITPSDWFKTEKFKGELPEVLKMDL